MRNPVPKRVPDWTFMDENCYIIKIAGSSNFVEKKSLLWDFIKTISLDRFGVTSSCLDSAKDPTLNSCCWNHSVGTKFSVAFSTAYAFYFSSSWVERGTRHSIWSNITLPGHQASWHLGKVMRRVPYFAAAPLAVGCREARYRLLLGCSKCNWDVSSIRLGSVRFC